MCIFIYVCMYVYIYIFIYMYICVYTYICVCVCVHVYMYRLHIHSHTHICICVLHRDVVCCRLSQGVECECVAQRAPGCKSIACSQWLVLQCVAVRCSGLCCSVSQCVAVACVAACRSALQWLVLQRVAVRCSGLCCSVLQCVAVACVAVCRSALQCVAVPRSPHLAASQSLAWWSLVLQSVAACAAVCCSLLLSAPGRKILTRSQVTCVAVCCCSLLQSVAVCCSLLSVFLCEHLAAKLLFALRSFVLQSVAACAAACVAACAALCCGVSCVFLCEILAATQWLASRSLVLQSVAVCCSLLPLHRSRPRPLSLCLSASFFWDILILCLQLEGCSRSDMSHSMTHSNVGHESVTWLSNMGIQPPGHDSFHDSFIFVTWLTHVCDVTHSYVWLDAFIFVTRTMVIYGTRRMENWCHYSCVSHDSVKWSSLK